VRDDEGRFRLYAVAAARKQALNELLNVVPEGWSTSLLQEQPSGQIIAALNTNAGEVREISQ